MNTHTESFLRAQAGNLPDELGFDWTEARPGSVEGRFKVEPRHLAPNGYLHAATVVALADSACGFGCSISLPGGASGFTTAELKVNFIGTVRAGDVSCTAQLVHAGRTTQAWDAQVKRADSGKAIALFRCTQLMLHSAA